MSSASGSSVRAITGEFGPYIVAATALKILLIPAYHSTDFEVHRNWLAITHSLPIKQWYFEATSEWTLDYPPFFAYFEWVLSKGAQYADAAMLNVKNLGYDSWSTICYQRSTVIITELILALSLILYVKGTSQSEQKRAMAVALSIFMSPGLLIIDHIHFQYNGFLYGILMLSLVLGRQERTMLWSAFFFAVVLCFKHIYLYLAPAYFVYLLRAYCLSPHSLFQIRFVNTFCLGFIVICTFVAAFGPFALWSQLPQVISRLFPFSRGLNHAYWAPNIWALYSFADRLLIPLAPFIGQPVDRTAVNSVTRGLVGDTSFAVLPNITPRVCFLLTLAAQTVCLVKLFIRPTWDFFVGAVTLCGYASFLFGWHVHEKAILLVIIPFSLLAVKDRRHLGAFRPLAVAGHVSLFPLLFTEAEYAIKTVYTTAWLLIFLLVFDRVTPASASSRFFLLDRISLLYIVGSLPLLIYCSLIHHLVFAEQLAFIPLMLTSVYSAIGVFGSWLGFMFVYFTS